MELTLDDIMADVNAWISNDFYKNYVIVYTDTFKKLDKFMFSSQVLLPEFLNYWAQCKSCYIQFFSSGALRIRLNITNGYLDHLVYNPPSADMIHINFTTNAIKCYDLLGFLHETINVHDVHNVNEMYECIGTRAKIKNKPIWYTDNYFNGLSKIMMLQKMFDKYESNKEQEIIIEI